MNQHISVTTHIMLFIIRIHTQTPMLKMSKNWNILNWNVRGIYSFRRWNDIRQKIEESTCYIMTLQETKKESFDMAYIFFALRDLISISTSPPMAALVVLLLYGMPLFSLANLSLRITIRLQWNSLQIMTAANGFSPMYMGQIQWKEKMSSQIGSLTLIPQI